MKDQVFTTDRKTTQWRRVFLVLSKDPRENVPVVKVSTYEVGVLDKWRVFRGVELS